MGHWNCHRLSMECNRGALPKTTFEVTYIGCKHADAENILDNLLRKLNIYLDGIGDVWLSEIHDTVHKRRKIEKVIFNDPATIIIWDDKTKTVVKCGEGEKYDPEKGFAMAIAKYALGNKGNYYETFKKWLPEEENDIVTVTNETISDLRTDVANLFSQFMNPPE